MPERLQHRIFSNDYIFFSGKWFAEECTKEKPFLCIKEPPETTTELETTTEQETTTELDTTTEKAVELYHKTGGYGYGKEHYNKYFSKLSRKTTRLDTVCNKCR